MTVKDLIECLQLADSPDDEVTVRINYPQNSEYPQNGETNVRATMTRNGGGVFVIEGWKDEDY